MNRKRPVIKIALIFLVFAVTGTVIIYQLFSNRAYSFTLNGERLATPASALKLHDQLYVPASFLQDALDLKIDWSYRQVDPTGAKPFYSDQVAVLMYHDIAVIPDKDTVISAGRFEEQMELLGQAGFNVITMDQYASFMLDGGKVPDNAVLITFDDGYESFYKLAYPILKKHGYTATDFVIVGSVDKPRKGDRPKLTWDQMREMQKNGMCFYSHTYDSHRYGTVDETGLRKPVTTHKLYLKRERRTETDAEYVKRMSEDLGKAERRLREELGNKRSVLAFPYGANTEELLAIAHSVGIDLTFTVDEGINSSTNWTASRINGADSSLSGERLIAKLKLLDDGYRIVVNGTKAGFAGLQPFERAGELMVPLREFCQMWGIGLSYDRWRNRIELEV